MNKLSVGFLAFMFIAFAFAACNRTNSDSRSADQSTQLVVTAATTALRETAGEDARVLQRLHKGDILQVLSQVSHFTTRLHQQGKTYDEPWLLARTTNGIKGWVYAADVQLDVTDEAARRVFALENRLQSLTDAAFTTRLARYRQEYASIATAADFAAVFRSGRTHCDSLVNILTTKVAPSSDKPGDLFWIGELFPGYMPQLVAEGTAYYLFEDYRQWLAAAQKTPETDDDELIQLFISAFPEDSIAYFFPVWTIQTTDYTGHSLLGRGHHFRLLQQAQTLLTHSRRFEPEIVKLKIDLLNDMTQAGVSYWESPEKIVAELDAIWSAGLNLWTPADKIALQTRREQLENPENFGILVNQQAGF